ncbi:MAG: protein kinase family protein [Coriobacteriales bacterium]|jgi:serine/threonine protein kinase
MADETHPISNATAPMNTGVATGVSPLLEPVTLTFTGAISGKAYSVNIAEELGRGGEAVIVRATDGDGKQYAARIYNKYTYLEQKNHEDVLRVINALTVNPPGWFHKTHLMPLYDFGTIRATIAGTSDTDDFNIAIVPECKCLGNSVVDTEVVKSKIIPEIAHAIKSLHENKIVHRDIKPSNIFEFEGELVLGDFGISTMFQGNQTAKGTTTNRGTIGYTHPDNRVDYSDDWYAFGYTIWTMYNGNVHPLQHYIDSGTIYETYTTKRVVEFEPKDESDKTLGDLIYDLTQIVGKEDEEYYHDVQSWLENPQSFRYEGISTGDSQRTPTGYQFNGEHYTDNFALAQALSKDWEGASKCLYSGDLIDYFGSIGENDLSTDLRTIVRDDAGVNEDFGISKAIFLISGDGHLLQWSGLDISFEILVEKFNTTPVEDLGMYDKVFSSGILSWALRNMKDPKTTGIIETVEFVELVSDEHPRLARGLFQHLFASGGVSKYAGFQSAEELTQQILQNPFSFYQMLDSKDATEDVYSAFSPFLAKNGKLESVATAAEAESKNTLESATHMLVFLDNVGDGSPAARWFMLNFGPVAPWYWVVCNIDSYKASHSRNAGSLIKEIANTAVPNETVSVASMVSKGEELRLKVDKLVNLMDRSPLTCIYGVNFGSKVVAQNDDALFCGFFYDLVVTRGFARWILNSSGVSEDAWDQVSLLSLSDASDRIDEDITRCTEVFEKFGGTDGGEKNYHKRIFHIVIDICAIAVTVILFMFAFDGLNGLITTFFETFGVDSGTTTFTILTIFAIMAYFIFSIAVDAAGIHSTKGFRQSLRKAGNALDSLKHDKDTFCSGTHPYCNALRDPGSVHGVPNIEADMDSLELEQDNFDKLYKNKWVKAFWYITFLITSLYFTMAVTVGIMLQYVDYDVYVPSIIEVTGIIDWAVFLILQHFFDMPILRSFDNKFSSTFWLALLFYELVVLAVLLFLGFLLSNYLAELLFFGFIIGFFVPVFTRRRD